MARQAEPPDGIEALRARLAEAEETLDAIRTGQVDSIVVEGPQGLSIYTLQGAERTYRILVETIAEGAATLSVDGTILYANSSLAAMLGTPLERVVGTSLRDYVPAEHQATLEALLRPQPQGRRDELALQARDGGRVPVLLAANTLQEQGAVVSCVVATDLREQRRNEELVASERLARSMLEQAAEAIVVCDAEGRVLRASRTARALCGDNPLRRPFDEVFAIERTGRPGPPDGATASAAPGSLVAEALDGEVLQSVPGRLHRGRGLAPLEVMLSAGPLRGARGQVLGCVVTLTDVTEERRAEEALREADHRKDEFLAILSHELRNPLAPIRSSMYVLERAAPGGEQARRAHAVIERQVDHLTRLVDDLLDVTRLSRGKITLQRETLDLVGLVQRTVEDFRTVLDTAGLRLVTRLPDGPAWVHGDRTRLEQVVGNLLQNAVKFTPSGGHIALSVTRDEAAREVRVQVRDTGIGIEPQTLPSLFEPFVQADRSLDRSRGGLGLGLALVKALVALHDGRVEAASPGAGQGAEFLVHLPLAAPPAEAARPAESRPPDATGRRVLVIEDHPDAAESLRMALELSGHRVEVAGSGPQGLALAEATRPEVVLCDIGLPGMDGYAVARAFRSHPALSGVHLVALSGYAQSEDRERALEAGFQHHLAKPPRLDVLERLLATLPSRT